MGEEALKTLAEIQQKLFTVEELLESQHSKQEQLTNEMLTFSNDVICELRLLSLIRSTIIENTADDVNKIIKSQTLQGLNFSALEYCPSFFESNLLNHYMTFISFLRINPSILAKAFYYFSKTNPKDVGHMAYSVFLTLFQQGWCYEEDDLLFATLKEFATIQFQEMDKKEEPSSQARAALRKAKPDVTTIKLAKPLNSPEIVLSELEPFASFVSAYLFNGASFSYLQCSLSQIVSILHSLSSLRDMHNAYQEEDGIYAAFAYWRTICQHAKLCFRALIDCMELLPAGVTDLFNMIRKHPRGGDSACVVLFFESFVNRALDNPAVLGLVPWHPGASEWSPSKDISSIFRAKYCSLLKSGFLKPLSKVLERIPEYNSIDFGAFLDALTNPRLQHSALMSEKELLSTNPSFPKELVITGRDLCDLHAAALAIPNGAASSDPRVQENFELTLKRLGAVPETNELALEHFRIVLQRQKEITNAAKMLKTRSLFEFGDVTAPARKDPFAEFFCDVIAKQPSFVDFIGFLGPKDAPEFVSQMRILTPHFLKEKDLLEADTVLYYALHNVGDFGELLPRVTAVTDSRHTRAMEAADRTSALNTQHQRLSSALSIVQAMRENVQSHLLFVIATNLVRSDLSRDFTIALSKSYSFLGDLGAFNDASIALMETTAQRATDIGLNPAHVAMVARILFFKLTDHITFQRFLISSLETWKRSVIITNIVEKNQAELNKQLLAGWESDFELRRKYLTRAADLLGHIRPTSGVSIITYFVVEAVSLVTGLTKQCRDLKFDPCMLWVMVNTKAKHLYGLGRFIGHFLLGNSFIDTLLSAKEIQHMGVFSSAICMLLRLCEPYNKHINQSWY